MNEFIMDYNPYNLWSDKLIAEPSQLTTVDSSPWAIRGSDDNSTVISKELIDSINKEAVEQIKNEHKETKFIWDKEKYYIKHR